MKNTALGFVLGLLLGLGLAFVLDRLDDRLRLPEDVQRASSAPILGSVLIDSEKKHARLGALPKTPRHLVSADSLDAEAYRTLATSLRFSSLGQDKQIVAITSSSGSEGKSTVTANLAAALIDSGLNVVLVSADLRRPSIGEVFGVKETKLPGLSDALLGTVPVRDTFVPVDLPSGRVLQLVPSGALPPNPAEFLASRRLADLLAELSRDVDYVLLDCPPVLPVSDVLGIAQSVDGVVVLAVPGRTRSHQLVEACDRLRNVGAGIFGVVLNAVPRQPGRYGSYQHYYRAYDKDVSVDTPVRS
jgi:non-specific protein-tyrosine kinase